jgi:hypothetical protein
VPKSGLLGSVRGAPSNGRPYRERKSDDIALLHAIGASAPAILHYHAA